jgi:predicted transcriptional regulator
MMYLASNSNNMPRITVSVSEEIQKEIKALADAENRSDSQMSGLLIAQALKERERNRKKAKRKNEEAVSS